MGRDGISNNDPLADKKIQGPGHFRTARRRPARPAQAAGLHPDRGNIQLHGPLHLLPPHTTLGKKLEIPGYAARSLCRALASPEAISPRPLAGLGRAVSASALLRLRQVRPKAGCAVSTTSCGLRTWMRKTPAKQSEQSGMDLIAFFPCRNRPGQQQCQGRRRF